MATFNERLLDGNYFAIKTPRLGSEKKSPIFVPVVCAI